jgi:hypothetical protein
LWTIEATERDVTGSIVEQSMNRRDSSVGAGGRVEARMASKTDSTCWGSGSTVIIVSWQSISVFLYHVYHTFEAVERASNQRIGY